MEYINHPWLHENKIQRRMYQENIAKTAARGNTLCVIPTGMGKTNIAALVVADRLNKDMDKKILFMAPTKPLVEQHKRSFGKFLKIGESELKVVTGSNDPDDRRELYKKSWIVFSTPQTIRNDLKVARLSLKDFSLVIFDEAHRAVGDYAYSYIAKVYMSQAEDPLILGLTASPGSHQYKINEVRDTLFVEHVEVRSRDDDDVKPYIQKVDYDLENVELTDDQKKIKKYLESIKEEKMGKLRKWGIIRKPFVTKTEMIRIQQELARKKTGMGYAAMSRLAEIIKVDHALLLLETQCLYSLNEYMQNMKEQETKAVERLMKNEKFIIAEKLVKQLIERGEEHPKLKKLNEIVSKELEEDKYAGIIIFAQFRDTITQIMHSLRDVKNAAPVEFIGQAKKRGKGLTQKEQIAILNDFKAGFYNILIASQVGEEGLDIEETNSVIFYEAVPSAIRRVQRTGRTARTKPGKVFVLVAKDTRDEAYYWSGHHKERKMKNILNTMKKQTELKEFTKRDKK
ncbi:DEAD/DEAH box helicase [Candidatus Aenigmatarchaeota archaeon]